MIEIDLLPLEFREKKRIHLEKIFKAKTIVIVSGCLVVFHLLLYFAEGINHVRLGKLQKSWQGLSPKRGQVGQLKEELARINEKIPLIEQLISNRVVWSTKLNRISDLLIGGVWLNSLNLEKRKTTKPEPFECLVIQGSAASRTKDEPALIGRFMQNLKDDPAFSAVFVEIELGPIKKRQIAQTEVMDFELICRFKPDRVQALLR